MRPFEYVRADDAAAAVALVSADPQAEYLAGGTTVTSNVVLVGPTRTSGLDELVSGMNGGRAGNIDESYRALMTDKHPTSLLGRPGAPEEVAAFVTFLASPLSSLIRRGVLRADGGFVPTVT